MLNLTNLIERRRDVVSQCISGFFMGFLGPFFLQIRSSLGELPINYQLLCSEVISSHFFLILKFLTKK